MDGRQAAARDLTRLPLPGVAGMARGMHGPIPTEARAARFDPLARVYHRLLDRIDRGLAMGAIEAECPDGRRRLLGGRAAGPLAIVRLHRWRALRRLAVGGSAGWYEAWAAGDWSSPDPVPLFELFVCNRHSLGEAGRASPFTRALARLLARLRHRNTGSGARRNAAAHYDLGNDFYREWLDPSLTYSSAIFAEPIDSAEPLEAAQSRKIECILARTGVAAGQTLLEIGCGWGSLAQAAAARGIVVHGITLSAEQQAFAAVRLASTDATVKLTDYRHVTGIYDAIASVEMVEAVGQRYWPDFIAVLDRALKPGGRAALQFIAIDDAIFASYAANIDFIQRYVFPGGMLISEQRLRALAEARGLRWTDRATYGAHYAETLRRWRAAFDRAMAEHRLPERFDARFVALWRYYLMYCEGGFAGGGIEVVQVTLVKG